MKGLCEQSAKTSFCIRALTMFAYSTPTAALITLNVKTLSCYTVKIIKKLKNI
jgi:hypothetical protein